MSENEEVETKEITLQHNGYDIKIEITKDLEKTKELIMKKLYFQKNDLEKFGLFYLDEDDCENDIDEDNITEAFDCNKWGTKSFNDDQEKEDEASGNKVDKSKDNEKINEETIKREQKRINEKIKKIKKELIDKFTKIANQKIAENKAKYDEKIKKLEEIIKSLKEKNKSILEEITKAHESTIQELIKNISKYAEDKIGSELDNYNKTFNESLSSQIEQNSKIINQQNNILMSSIKQISDAKENMRKTIDDSKGVFRDVFKMSAKNISNK